MEGRHSLSQHTMLFQAIILTLWTSALASDCIGSMCEPSDVGGRNYFDAYHEPAKNGMARLITIFPLLQPSTPLSSGADADESFDLAHVLESRPNVYSGLTVDTSDESSLTFIGISDRGPVSRCRPDENGKNFVWPHFSPSMYQLHLNPVTNLANIVHSCPLRVPFHNTSGDSNTKYSEAGSEPRWVTDGVTGLPNTGNDEVPYENECQDSLERNMEGIDSEDIQKIPGSTYCMGVDEYSPSIFVMNCDFDDWFTCGMVQKRYLPQGLNITQSDVRYPLSHILPSALTYRRRSRGFEALAISPDGQTAIAVMESAMGDVDGPQKHSHSLMSVKLNIADPLNATLLGTHILLAKDAKSFVPGSNGRSKTKAKHVKVSGASWASQYMNRDNDAVILVLTRGKDQVLAQAADYTNATDVTAMLESDPLMFDSLGGHKKSRAALLKLGVSPASLRTFFDSGDISSASSLRLRDVPPGLLWSDKQEGMTIINSCTLAFGNDNDFKRSSDMWVIQLSSCLHEGMSRDSDAHITTIIVVGLLCIGLSAVAFWYLIASLMSHYLPVRYTSLEEA